ncbi:MAG TPA: tyrosine-protein phosphatase [Blastocatellia bacterium]|nr:tyrosine-protein phosphatase [Blastocatellia bacterium]
MKINSSFSAITGHALSKTAVTLSLVLSLFFSLAPAARAGSDKKHEASETGISNFGKIDDHYYRGAQPDEEEYSRLAALGIRTIIDLRDDPKDYARPMAEQAGLRYINLPMSDKRYPPADAAQRFLEIANNPQNWPVYVHCAGGRHRTGVMTAVYRITVDGWDIDQAYREMKQYDFYSRQGHQQMKKFIFNYYREMKQAQARAEQQKDSSIAASNHTP